MLIPRRKIRYRISTSDRKPVRETINSRILHDSVPSISPGYLRGGIHIVPTLTILSIVTKESGEIRINIRFYNEQRCLRQSALNLLRSLSPFFLFSNQVVFPRTIVRFPWQRFYRSNR